MTIITIIPKLALMFIRTTLSVLRWYSTHPRLVKVCSKLLSFFKRITHANTSIFKRFLIFVGSWCSIPEFWYKKNTNIQSRKFFVAGFCINDKSNQRFFY